MIHFENVCKNFDGKQVLAGVSFDVVEGEILAIVGPSGTGKSVTLKHIVGLLAPDSGTVILSFASKPGTATSSSDFPRSKRNSQRPFRSTVSIAPAASAANAATERMQNFFIMFFSPDQNSK